MLYKIEIKDKPGIFDAVGQGIKKDILDLGIETVSEVRFIQVYIIDPDICRGHPEYPDSECNEEEGNEGSHNKILPPPGRCQLTEEEIRRICEELLVDGISQDYIIGDYFTPPPSAAGLAMTGQPQSVRGNPAPGQWTIEVAYNPGVMDPVEQSALKGMRDLGMQKPASFKTAKKYLIKGSLSEKQLSTICDKLLYNKLIQHIVQPSAFSFQLSAESAAAPPLAGRRLKSATTIQVNLITVDLLSASDRKLKQISKQGQLFLNLIEMKHIQRYFKKLGRNPTDCELETIAQTWSEHCWHKTFRGKIRYTEKILNSKSEILTKPKTQNPKPKTRLINNLLKSTIMKATKEIKAPWCVSVFKDNSGIIRFDEKYNVCFKVETHNHPSALEPFGGANTGIGGVIRDPMGTGLGAKPILNTDVFCFGRPDFPFSKLPPGTLHPKHIAKGVVSGVRDYGNKMGIPTINGAVLFHDRFVGNPLVYCGTVGILAADKCFKQAKIGDLIVVVGGRTGRDGIHGATFSSAELTHESEKISSGAVQIGNPIQEKKMLDVILKAGDENLYTAITDCGAGGLSSAVGEMGADLGAEVYLEKVPLKYEGLAYTEIWISESQERMVLSVPQENIDRLKQLFKDEDVEAAAIGRFTDTKRLKLYYKDNLVCDLEMRFLHNGIPQLEKKAVFIQPDYKEPKIACPKNLTVHLIKLLSDYDICSKEWIIRQYDHEVQAGSVIKPLTGVLNDGPSDAAVVRPILGSHRGIIISNGINFRYGFIDPYWMAASCIDEALRQIIAAGGSLNQAAILDNFCWGNPDKPDRLGGLVRAALGCYDIAKGFAVPFISGKDSLYNEFTVNKKSMAIPGTLLISAIAVMEDVNRAVSMYAKQAGDLIYAAGETYNELGGSHYYDLFGLIGNNLPQVFPDSAKKLFNALSRASDLKLIRAMHDCSEGGLGVALAEMAFAGGLGMEIFLSEVPYTNREQRTENREQRIKNKKYNLKRNDFILFSESNSRFVVEVERRHQKEFEAVLKGLPFGLIGCISKDNNFKVQGLDGKMCIVEDIYKLKETWQKPLRW